MLKKICHYSDILQRSLRIVTNFHWPQSHFSWSVFSFTHL